MFGHINKSKDVTVSAVARFDPLRNEWTKLVGYGESRERFAVVNTKYGVVLVDGVSANTKLCQINETHVDCEDMENNDPVVFDDEVHLFTFDHTLCPNSVDVPAMLLLSTKYSRNELNEVVLEIILSK